MTQLIMLDDYEAPSMPTEHAVRKTLLRLRSKLGGANDDPVLQQDGLERTSLDQPDGAGEPSLGWLHKALDDELRDWSAQPSPDSWLKLYVLPPCDTTGIIEAWASAAGHTMLAAAQRHQLTADPAAAVPDLSGAGVLVIPRLEDWFVRQRSGLRLVRSLLAQLAELDRHCVIACNSWTWRFLVKAAGADVLLPCPRTLRPFDAARLRDWLTESVVADADRPVTFRLARTGEDVFATDDEGGLKSNHLQLLAARSFGIPWVAAQLWRASLRNRTASDDLPERAVRATADDARTVWVAEIDEPRLPKGHEDRSLLALQALLIHDAMTAPELDAVLPATGETDVMPALLAAGFVQREARSLRVRAVAYPTVRRALQAAGLPLGKM